MYRIRGLGEKISQRSCETPPDVFCLLVEMLKMTVAFVVVEYVRAWVGFQDSSFAI